MPVLLKPIISPPWTSKLHRKSNDQPMSTVKQTKLPSNIHNTLHDLALFIHSPIELWSIYLSEIIWNLSQTHCTILCLCLFCPCSAVLNGFPPLSLCLNYSEITSRKPFLTFLRQDQSSQSALHISVLQYILLYINFFCFHVSLLWWNVRFLKDKQWATLHLQQIMQCLTHLVAY